MSRDLQPLLSDAFLRSVWAEEFASFKGSAQERALIQRLSNWRDRKDLKETAAEQTFIKVFFHETWDYWGSGERPAADGYCLHPKLAVKTAGAGGGTGEADLALGWFGRDGIANTPQVLCEFKDIRSELDAPQKRKGNTRSPVQQCKDYLWGARQGLFGNEPIIPAWGVVTDMNEFRLYWWDRMPQQGMRFVIQPRDLFGEPSLLGSDDDASFRRFLFQKLFHANTLLTEGGRSELLRLLERQWFHERKIENEFYQEYRKYRARLYNELVASNPKFKGTHGRLVRLAQRILDRCLFILYCEDMGQALAFPPQLLREFLRSRADDPYFDPKATDIWDRIKSLFQVMNAGGPFPPNHKINRFNGGLFEHDPELEGLRLTNMVFCERGQGQNQASLEAHKATLLYFSAAYNYADRGSADKTLGLYTLGRIFEQSITELEVLEAEAEERPSLNKLSKRKLDGVYYTPEPIVEAIVRETIEPRLAELRQESGWKEGKDPTKEALAAYWERLRRFKVVDPACGSGAFLITAFRYLRREFEAVETLRKQKDLAVRLPKEPELIEDILSRNLYGVDINPASVEITKLALWLHTARPHEPLSALDRHIRDGNSLIGPEFYIKGDLEEYAVEKREEINAFDWRKAFPEVFAEGGFDAVVSNPPYVKLQNFLKVYPEMAEFLREGRLGKSYYESTQTGNFDLFLPFIEKGLSLLNENGRMGFIAPSLWLVNEYGEGLRRLVHSQRALDRWVDFKAYQVFDEAITYTALQFFSRQPRDMIRLCQAPEGQVSAIDWDDPRNAISYRDLRPSDAWILVPESELVLIRRLNRSSMRLNDPSLTTAIFQGLITSADDIYHLTKLGPGRYLCQPRKEAGSKKAPPPYEVEIEDAVMRPLVSGPEAKRYLEPRTDIYLLFPYELTGDAAILTSPEAMARKYPKAWKYLRSYEKKLRARENGTFNDEAWYRFGRHQNLDKQEVPKLIVAQTVPNMRVCYDDKAAFYLNNVRVNGILPSKAANPWFILGVLNGKVADWVFKRIAKPKEGGYFEANKQFIAPLPIPKCDKRAVDEIGALAKYLQEMTTERRTLVADIERRLAGVKAKKQPEHWLFPAIGAIESWQSQAPAELPGTDKLNWAKARREEAIEARLDSISSVLRQGVRLVAALVKNELRFAIDGRPAIDRVFVDPSEADFLLAQWDFVARTFAVTEKTTAKRLVDALRTLAPSGDKAVVKQIIDLHRQLVELDGQVAEAEDDVNKHLYRAYRLTPDEIRLVEQG